MFEKGKAIREAKKAEVLAKERQKEREKERRRIKAEMERRGIPVTADMEAILSGDTQSNG